MEIDKADIVAPASPYAAIYNQRDEVGSIMHCAIGLCNPINIDDIKSAFSNSMITKHPMFTSLMIKDRRGRYRWQKMQHPFNLDDHIVLYHHKGVATTTHEKEEAVNDYLANLVSMPLNKDKPLWELHMLIGLDCLVWRLHHSVGDGVSMFSIFLASFRTNPESDPKKPKGGLCCTESGENKKTKEKKKGRASLIKRLWWTIEYAIKLGAQMQWAKDRTTVIGGDGVELWPRKMVTVKFKLEDFKALKKGIPNVTVNDVFLGLISCALSKYLRSMDNQMQPHDHRISGMCAVNMRGVPFLQVSELSKSSTFSGWGNKIGGFHVSLKLLQSKSELHPLEHVKRMKSMMDRKKQSYEAHVSYLTTRSTFNLFGSKVSASMLKRYLVRTSFQCSNLSGPREVVAIAGNRVTYIRAHASCTPQAISIYLVTYAQRVDVQFMLAKDIIQNPEFLPKCFEESFYEMISAMV